MPGFGALDALDCPYCKGKSTMFLARRSPDPGDRKYEKQSFQCASCGKSLSAPSTRTAMRQPPYHKVAMQTVARYLEYERQCRELATKLHEPNQKAHA
jgi:transposase-like protein